MSEHSHIEWTDATWNPVTGCTKVSAGCKHCYAERDWKRLSANPKSVYYGRDFTDVQYHMARLEQPLRWTKPRRIFVNSMSDLFHESVSDREIADIFGVMAAAAQHQFQVLTKRPERMMSLLSSARFLMDLDECAAMYSPGPWVWPLRNVWLGASVEDRKHGLPRIDYLSRTPARVRMLSCEPLLEDLGELDLTDVDWVIVGGESGPKARPMHPDWVRSIRDQCLSQRVLFFFKQWGEWQHVACVEDSRTLPSDGLRYFRELDATFFRRGKKATGRTLDGRTWDEFPS